jgi:hypothetical protein
VTGGIVYLVMCRQTGRKYVGQTTRPLEDRWADHIAHARKGAETPLHRAIRKYGPEQFEVRLLEVVSDLRQLNARELALSKVHNSMAPLGYNLRAGDGSDVEVTDEVRRAISDGTKAAFDNPEVRANHRAGLVAAWNRPDSRESFIQGRKRAWADPVEHERRAAIGRGVVRRPDVRARNSAFHADFQNRPDVRDANSRRAVARLSDPSVLAQLKAASRSRWSKPGARERQSAAMKVNQNLPEQRAIHSEKSKAAWANPDVRERILEARRQARGKVVK